jgi:hypothetical protein
MPAARAGRSSSSVAALLGSLLAGVAACGGESPNSGVTALLRVAGGQYEAGALNTDTRAIKPTVDSIKSNNTHVFPGAQGRALTGSVSGTATAVLIGLAGDDAHWLVPDGVADLDTPGNFTFAATLSFSPDLPVGPRELILRAVDADGQVGPAQQFALKVDDRTPKGALVISLRWDTQADLDLHVRVPNPSYDPANKRMLPYKDVWAKAPLALPPPPSSDPPYTQAQLDMAGKLDFDSNSQCVIDGLRQEDLIFPQAPPKGTYEVRVDAFAMCGEATARWDVAAYLGDPAATPPLKEAYGQLGDLDTLTKHDGSAGTLAFTFTIP